MQFDYKRDMEMVPQNTEHVLITGTTSGIGRGLMDFYIKRGAKVTAVNRRRDPDLESRYPSVQFHMIDVQDTRGIEGLIEDLAAHKNIPSTFILNAGINKVDNDTSFSIEAFREALNINLFGALNFAAPLIARWRELATTRVIAISSTTNYAANPFCLGYFISKKALTQSFEVFSEMYRNTNLQFKWVVLGPVLTPIATSSQKFPKIMLKIKDLFSVSVEQTAQALYDFSKSDRPCLIYPFRARILFRCLWLAQQLIPGFYRGRKTPLPK